MQTSLNSLLPIVSSIMPAPYPITAASPAHAKIGTVPRTSGKIEAKEQHAMRDARWRTEGKKVAGQDG